MFFKKSLQRILQESIREMERGASLESVLSRYPDRAEELRPHLRVWQGLTSAKKAAAPAGASHRGLQRLRSELALASTNKGGISMERVSETSGLLLKFAGAFAIVAGIVLSFAALSGNFSVNLGDGGSAAAGESDIDGDGVIDTEDNCPLTANPDQTDTDGDGLGDVCDPNPDGGLPDCLDVVDFNGDGTLDGNDVLAFKAAFGSEEGDANYDPSVDVDGDGDVDLFDVTEAVNQIVDCLQQLQPPTP